MICFYKPPTLQAPLWWAPQQLSWSHPPRFLQHPPHTSHPLLARNKTKCENWVGQSERKMVTVNKIQFWNFNLENLFHLKIQIRTPNEHLNLVVGDHDWFQRKFLLLFNIGPMMKCRMTYRIKVLANPIFHLSSLWVGLLAKLMHWNDKCPFILLLYCIHFYFCATFNPLILMLRTTW